MSCIFHAGLRPSPILRNTDPSRHGFQPLKLCRLLLASQFARSALLITPIGAHIGTRHQAGGAPKARILRYFPPKTDDVFFVGRPVGVVDPAV